MEEWMMKMMDIAEMAKLTALIRDQTLSKFNADWKSSLTFLHETEKNEFIIHNFDNQKNQIRTKCKQYYKGRVRS